MVPKLSTGLEQSAERPISLLLLVEAELQHAGFQRAAADATDRPAGRVQSSGYTVYPLYADAEGMRDGIVVLEHVPGGDDSLHQIHAYQQALTASPSAPAMRVRQVTVGIKQPVPRLWIWQSHIDPERQVMAPEDPQPHVERGQGVTGECQ